MGRGEGVSGGRRGSCVARDRNVTARRGHDARGAAISQRKGERAGCETPPGPRRSEKRRRNKERAARAQPRGKQIRRRFEPRRKRRRTSRSWEARQKPAGEIDGLGTETETALRMNSDERRKKKHSWRRAGITQRTYTGRKRRKERRNKRPARGWPNKYGFIDCSRRTVAPLKAGADAT